MTEGDVRHETSGAHAHENVRKKRSLSYSVPELRKKVSLSSELRKKAGTRALAGEEEEGEAGPDKLQHRRRAGECTHERRSTAMLASSEAGSAPSARVLAWLDLLVDKLRPAASHVI